MMQKRHFELIALAISSLVADFDEPITKPLDGEDDYTYRDDVAFHFAGYLAHTNPNFKRDTFLRACGVNLD